MQKTPKKNVLLIGRGTIAVECLNHLAKSRSLPCVVICDRNDNGKDTWTKSLYKKAIGLGYKDGKNLFKVTKVNEDSFVEMIKKRWPDLHIIFSVQPKAIFRTPFIGLAREHVINLHFAPLPKLRGVAPCSWAILDGLEKMGVTLHLILQKGVDDGPIIFQKTFPITLRDTARSLYDKCVREGSDLFKKNLHHMLLGRFKKKKQDARLVTYHPMGSIDFNQLKVPTDVSVKEALAFIRARIFPPMQLPYFMFKKRRIYIKGIKPLKETAPNVGGTVGFDPKLNTYRLYFRDGVLQVDNYSHKSI